MRQRKIDSDTQELFQTLWVQLDPNDSNDADKIRALSEEFDGATASKISKDDEPGIFWAKCVVPSRTADKFKEKLQELTLIN